MKDLLRFVTAGSVDDGKSTLIGRLLHDARAVYEDQLESVRKESKNAGPEGLDLAFITDGLRAEREQGITIDVAYRYFETRCRKFIIADCPGHEQYTRNMATGASNSEVALVLLDVRNGALPQSRRHAFIASLLGIRKVVVAVNKMDLADYDREAFEACCEDFRPFLQESGFDEPQFIPVSALVGDNIVSRSERMPWYTGPSLLEYLETVEPRRTHRSSPFRFPVQLVLRPNSEFRGYAGRIASGRIRQGDEVVVLPSRLVSRIAAISSPEGNLSEGEPPLNPVLCLEDHLDVSRGDMFADPVSPPSVARRFSAMLIWMSPQPLRCDSPYLLKHTTRQVCANVRRVNWKFDIQSLAPAESQEVRLNDIGEVEIETHRPLYFDSYRENRTTGSFILIDMISNHTVAAGMIQGSLEPVGEATLGAVSGLDKGETTHRGLTVWLTGLSGAGKSTICLGVRDRLAGRGYRTEVLDGDVVRKHLSKGLGFSREDRDENIRRIGFVAGLLTRNGVIALAAAISPYRTVREEVRSGIGDFLEVYVNAPLEVCEARDSKGLYKKARAGEIQGFTGVDDPYEPPEHPDVECRTDRESVEESVEKVLHAIDRTLASIRSKTS